MSTYVGNLSHILVTCIKYNYLRGCNFIINLLISTCEYFVKEQILCVKIIWKSENHNKSHPSYSMFSNVVTYMYATKIMKKYYVAYKIALN